MCLIPVAIAVLALFTPLSPVTLIPVQVGASSPIAEQVDRDDCDDEQERDGVSTEVPLEVLSPEALERILSSRRASGVLSAEIVEEALQVAEEIDPMMAGQLRGLQQKDPVAFQRAMQTTGRRLIGMAELKSRDSRLYGFKLAELRIEGQVNRAAARLREAVQGGSSETEQLEQELRQQVQIQIAISLGARGEYLRRLKEHVKALEESIDQDALHFNDTVQQRLDQILRGIDDGEREENGGRSPDASRSESREQSVASRR